MTNEWGVIRRRRMHPALMTTMVMSPYSGASSVANCDSVGTATCFQATISGVINGTDANCGGLNGTFKLARPDETGCVWLYQSNPSSPLAGPGDFQLTLLFSTAVNLWTLYVVYRDAGSSVTTIVIWACPAAGFDASGGTFNLQSNNSVCGGYPASIVVSSVAC